ncbi:hypothetical protein [uncultured Phascolarctobacterium sp.]|uniref:hypothetical protein n=1 Tax=uncultured Phascolarctobacterium sp. TaxID=512296 RepID=UPI0025D8FE9A|nr:hypothetical protein [uncultured Phascolarctobacterium sp.]
MTIMQRAFPAPINHKFFTNNICGTYTMRRFFNGQDDFICAQPPLCTQTIASQSEESPAAPSLAIALANIDENDAMQVLNFCNAYGLPYSSQRCLEKRAHLDDENHSVLISDFSYIDDTLYLGDILTEKDYAAADAEVTLRYTLLETDEMDIMSLRLFARCVKIVRSILTIQSYLVKREGTQADVIYALAYLVHYSARGLHYLLPRIESPTLRAAEYFATTKRISYTQLLKQVRKIDTDYACQLQSFLELADEHLLLTLADYDKGLLTKKQLTTMIDNENSKNAVLDYAFARRVILDIINDNIYTARPQMHMLQEKFTSLWQCTYLMQAIYLDLYQLLLNPGEYRRCANPKCSNYFLISGRRADKRYCCNSCASSMGKKGKTYRPHKKK